MLTVCACGTPPNPPPSSAPAPARDDAGPAAPVAVDAAVARPPLDCPATGHLVRAAWPERGLACVDGAGRRDGPAVAYHPDGAVALRTTWQAGVLDGPWQRFGPDGALLVDGAYRAGQRDGTWRQLAGGVELGRSQLRAGTGTFTTWYPGGAIASVTTWTDGVRDGAARAFAPDGTLVVDERWAAGVRDGARVVGERATLELRETWTAGVRTGPRTIWRRGHLELDERYDRDGQLDGAWTAYRNARRLREQGAFAAGRRTGPWVWYDAGGNRTREGSYRRGARDGAWLERTGTVVTWTGSYRAGLPDGAFVTFDRKGAELGRDVLARGTGVVRTFHAGGEVETETPLLRGDPHGAFRRLTARGRVVEAGRFERGVRVGPWFAIRGDARRDETYASGALDGAVRRTRGDVAVLEATYVRGARDGAYRERFPDGTPALVGQLAGDRKDGAWTTYRRDGSVAIRAHYRDGLLDGAYQELDAAGAVRVAGQHQRGHRVGVWTTVAADGTGTTTDHGAPDP